MTEELLPFDMKKKPSSIIKVIGIGGGGSNAVKNMHIQGISGVDFIICNTDKQALDSSIVENKIQLGPTLTEGLGAGSVPAKGREAAVESIEEVKAELDDNTKMVFITAGMGGGTGTGAAPIIAEAAHELDKLTVGIVTIPFGYEGKQRIRQAIEGIREMNNFVDALLVVNNEKLREIYGELDIDDAYKKADDVLTTAAKGIAEIITKEGYVNVDFADVQTVMKNSGIALMGAGKANGEDRAVNAVNDALSSPLLDNNDIDGAKNLLINISYSSTKKATMDEISDINEMVQDAAGNEADLISGSSLEESLGDNIAVTIIATGFGEHDIPALYSSTPRADIEPKKIKYNLDDDESKIEKNTIEEQDTSDKIVLEIDDVTDTDDLDFEEDNLSKDPFSLNDEIFDKKQTPSSSQSQEEEKQTNISILEPQTKNSRSMNYSENLHDLEKTPAYLRNNIDLEIKNDYSSEEYSRYTVSKDDNGPVMRKNNQYLHEKPD